MFLSKGTSSGYPSATRNSAAAQHHDRSRPLKHLRLFGGSRSGRGREGLMLVEWVPVLKAVVELAEESVEEVALGSCVPVTGCAAPSVVFVGASGTFERGEGPEESCVHQPVVFDVSSADVGLFPRCARDWG